MATLKVQRTAFEYIPMEKSELYLESKIKFILGDKNFINPKLLRDDDGYIKVYEDVDCSIVEFLKEVLREDKPNWWECVDDIVEIAVYPDEFFPFMSKKREISSVTDDLQTQASLRPRNTASDYFTIIIFVRSYHFDSKNEYTPSGISLHLYIQRDELEKFVQEIEQEKGKMQH
jgi:hypothetical protein